MVFGGGSNDIEIKVKVDAQGAVTVLDDLGNELKKVESGAGTASGGFTAMQASILTLTSAVNLAKDAFSLLRGAGDLAIGAISRGSDVNDMADSFARLSKEAGTSGDVLLNNLNRALGETIPNFDLMKQANELFIGGLKPNEIETVAKAARALGEATGTDAAQGMQQLSDSLLRGNDRALKSLGIIIDNTKASKEYAAANNILNRELTEGEKVLAIREASIRALGEQEERFGEITNDAKDLIAQANKIITDSFDDVWKSIASDAGVNQALKEFVATIKTINVKALAKDLAAITTEVIKLAEATAKFVNFLVSNTAIVINSLKGMDAQFNSGLRRVVELGKAIPILGGVLGGLDVHLKQTDLAQQALNKSTGAAQGVLAGMIIGLKSTATAANETTGFIGPLNQEIEKTGSVIQTTAGRVQTESKKIQDSLKPLEDKKIEIPVIISAKRVGPGAGESNTTDWSAIGAEAARGISGAFVAAMNGASGQEMRSSIVSSLGSIASTAFPSAAPFIQAAVPLVGALIEKIFGGEHAGTTARKKADKFFADVFAADRLSVIINGQLTQIEDLVFRGDTLFGGDVDFTNSSFSQFLAGLPGEAQAAFNGVGTAFEELLGVGQDVGGQLAAVFANNVGGSLNNLQLLVEATGKTFDELKGAVVEAFLDGKISVLEAQTALNGLAQVAQKGIPDALGATAQAFDNLKIAGGKGGRALIDAMQDVAYEARELGIKDFGALATNIVAAGKYSSEEVSQYFDILKQHGITSVDQLVSATTEQLIGVASQLQAVGGLANNTASQTGGIVEQINNLPDSKTVTINVKTNLDSNTQTAIKNGIYEQSFGKTSNVGVPTQ